MVELLVQQPISKGRVTLMGLGAGLCSSHALTSNAWRSASAMAPAGLQQRGTGSTATQARVVLQLRDKRGASKSLRNIKISGLLFGASSNTRVSSAALEKIADDQLVRINRALAPARGSSAVEHP